MNAGAFAEGTGKQLAHVYPERPGLLSHRLAEHPLLDLESLAALAWRMRPSDVQICRGDVAVGIGRRGAPEIGLSPLETISAIERCGAWMVLKYVEQDGDYKMLLDALLDELEPAVRPVTGPMLKREAFIFLSSPGAVTPLHFDPEHNVLLQLRGRKKMVVFPAGNEALVSGPAHEAFHEEGANGLEWSADFADRGHPFELTPGDALYVPVKAPHFVENGDEPSISLSITWRSGWSLREGYAHGANRLLRKAGLQPRPPRRFPADNHLKSLAFRAIERARRVKGLPG
jgi:hypothetical protein